MRISDVLRDVARELEPDPGAIAEATRRARSLADELHRCDAEMFRVEKCSDHGSVHRGTCIRGFADLDVLVELDPEALKTANGDERSPSDTISRMARALQKRRGGLVALGSVSIRKQDHSVGVLYGGRNGFRIDLVPAIRQPFGRLKIPERGSGRWIIAQPARTLGRLQEARACEPDTVAAIRLLKGWRRARGRNAPIPSFGIETMVVGAVLGGQLGLESLVRGFFDEIARADARRRMGLGGASPGADPVTLIDPVSKANLTVEIVSSQRGTLVETCRRAQDALDEIEARCADREAKMAKAAARRLFLKRR